MRNRIVYLTCAVLLTAALAGCTREDPDCAAAGEALSDTAYREQLKATVQRLFDAGELGEINTLVRPGTPPDLPGRYGVAVAPEFKAVASKPLYQRTLFDARDHLVAVFVGWAAGKGVVVDLANEEGVVPAGTFAPTIDYGDGVQLVCSPQD
ncbi:hypothetical protein [Pseudoxanthomonas sacheonensis]|uniref:Lipoprotein n=1 Tax=Pseudoxanthomonas sacheonensis TaxID=443615 RepID=A0ABU1RUR7_9GAMM|nr:hypothetical protein [Pseudoxanthomonas sacheonensis]MDR6842527.1 hypothetical protein [Pseudoxanthomonas sacheonensis]